MYREEEVLPLLAAEHVKPGQDHHHPVQLHLVEPAQQRDDEGEAQVEEHLAAQRPADEACRRLLADAPEAMVGAAEPGLRSARFQLGDTCAQLVSPDQTGDAEHDQPGDDVVRVDLRDPAPPERGARVVGLGHPGQHEAAEHEEEGHADVALAEHRLPGPQDPVRARVRAVDDPERADVVAEHDERGEPAQPGQRGESGEADRCRLRQAPRMHEHGCRERRAIAVGQHFLLLKQNLPPQGRKLCEVVHVSWGAPAAPVDAPSGGFLRPY